MKKLALLLVAGLTTSWLETSLALAEESQAAKIKRLQAEAKLAQLNAQGAPETQRAYEEAWRKTKSAAKGATCVAGGLYVGPAVGAACYAHNTYRSK